MLALTHGDEKGNANSAHKKQPAKFILQDTASASCCSVEERHQSPSLPRRRLGCRSAKLMLALTHGDEKGNANSAHKNTTTKFILQGPATARCCSVEERQQ
jgi:hypothetical protein